MSTLSMFIEQGRMEGRKEAEKAAKEAIIKAEKAAREAAIKAEKAQKAEKAEKAEKIEIIQRMHKSGISIEQISTILDRDENFILAAIQAKNK